MSRYMYGVVWLVMCVMAQQSMANDLKPKVNEAMNQDELTVVLEPSKRLDAALMFEEALHATWTPELADLSGAEAVLQKQLDVVRPALAAKWHGYMRQYIGASDKDGNRYVYGNYFCEAHGDWKKDLVVVMDGGDCYFQAVVDLKAQSVKHLMINGEA